MDPAEENDADDEGEIWYNPIPEDEEPEVSRRPSARLLVAPRAAPRRRPSGGGDGGQLLEVPGENLGGGRGSGDGSQGNGTHSTEALLLHRHMLVCKPQEEGGVSRATGMAETPWIPSFSPSLNLFSLSALFAWSLNPCSYTWVTDYSLC